MSWVKDRAKEAGKLDRYTRELEEQNQVLMTAIQELAEGYGAGGNFKTHASAMQRLAGNVLAKIAKMPRSSRPHLWWLE